jgi:nitric oxide reductase large subunit
MSPTEAYEFGVWLLLFLVTLPFIGAALWAFVSAARDKEKEERETDAPYQSLNTQQILGKIAKR